MNFKFHLTQKKTLFLCALGVTLLVLLLKVMHIFMFGLNSCGGGGLGYLDSLILYCFHYLIKDIQLLSQIQLAILVHISFFFLKSLISFVIALPVLKLKIPFKKVIVYSCLIYLAVNLLFVAGVVCYY